MKLHLKTLVIIVLIALLNEKNSGVNCRTTRAANNDAKRLYDDLITGYNRLIRPVGNNTEKLTVYMGLKLTQILDVDEKNQIMITNVWLRQVNLKIYFIFIFCSF
jgi:hypothetical protein